MNEIAQSAASMGFETRISLRPRDIRKRTTCYDDDKERDIRDQR